MTKERVFYQIYENLESELLAMTDYIHFSDENLSTYSVRLSSFILSCNTEIESLLKEINCDYFDGDKGEKIGTTFKNVLKNIPLKEKYVLIISNRFHFTEKYSSEFKPLKFKNSENKDLTKVYNAVKHDRASNLHKATLEVAINLLAFLYLLNVYYSYDNRMDSDLTSSSRVFALKTAQFFPLLYGSLSDSSKQLKKVEDYLASSSFISWWNDPISMEDNYSEIIHFRDHHLLNLTEEHMFDSTKGFYCPQLMFLNPSSRVLSFNCSVEQLRIEMSEFLQNNNSHSK